MLLAVDIGGTKADFAFLAGGQVVDEGRLDSRAFSGVEALIASLRARRPGPIEAACVAVPGPVVDGHAIMATLGWRAVASDLARQAGIPRLEMINDLIATAYGLDQLAPSDLVSLHAGEDRPHGLRAIIAPGTGIGHAFLTWAAGAWTAYPMESGHTGFAPMDEDACDLWRFLRTRGSRVYLQHACSGLALANLHAWLSDRGRGETSPPVLAEVAAAADPSRIIMTHALAGDDGRCVEVLEHFLRLLATEVQDVGLRLQPLGGIYLAGGLPVRLRQRLAETAFIERCLGHRELGETLHRMPIRLVLDPRTALRGAQARAQALLQSA